MKTETVVLVGAVALAAGAAIYFYKRKGPVALSVNPTQGAVLRPAVQAGSSTLSDVQNVARTVGQTAESVTNLVGSLAHAFG